MFWTGSFLDTLSDRGYGFESLLCSDKLPLKKKILAKDGAKSLITAFSQKKQRPITNLNLISFRVSLSQKNPLQDYMWAISAGTIVEKVLDRIQLKPNISPI